MQYFLKTALWHMHVFMHAVQLNYTKTDLADFIEIFYKV